MAQCVFFHGWKLGGSVKYVTFCEINALKRAAIQKVITSTLGQTVFSPQ